MDIATNALYYGDNLDILRKYIPDNSVDLIYLDPPFNSSTTYNVLFKEPTGKPSQAQMSAFEDTWHWGLDSEKALQDIINSPIAPSATKDFMSVLPKLVGRRTDMSAYLTMMCIRLIELRRVLKDTGSLYLHCDPTASHYLKLLMDTIFGPENFRNEITWKRFNFHADAHRFGRVADRILFYSKSINYKFNKLRTQFSDEYIESKFTHYDDNGRRFRLDNLNPPGGRGPVYEFHGVIKAWRYSKENMLKLEKEGKIYSDSKVPQLIRYLDDIGGQIIHDTWTDIPAINSQAKERLGYQTQKPEALLERIIKASSNEGDIVLDPFCGCGTAVVAAQKLNRKWIGMDITHLAIGLMKWRLKNLTPSAKFTVIGEPEDLSGAEELAKQDKYQFQWWAVSKVGGQPYGDKKKGADTGIDGYLYYMDEKDKIKKAIISVKGGHNTTVAMIRDLGHVIDREKADIGVFITLEKPTQPMITEAAMKGFYHSPLGNDYPRLQILTIEEIFSGKTPDIPPWIAPVPAQSSKSSKTTSKQPKML